MFCRQAELLAAPFDVARQNVFTRWHRIGKCAIVKLLTEKRVATFAARSVFANTKVRHDLAKLSEFDSSLAHVNLHTYAIALDSFSRYSRERVSPMTTLLDWR